MGSLIFKLRNVTDEEANEVRLLLADNSIAIYETDSGFFGTSVAGFWLHDDDQRETAKALLDEYAQQRLLRVRDEYQRQRDAGELETFRQRVVRQPIRFLGALLVVAVILIISIMPFFVL